MKVVDCVSQAGLDAAVAAGHVARVREGHFAASGSASVEAYGSASVKAYDSASVEAYGSASVAAYGSASVKAYDSASVKAGDYVPVQRAHGHTGAVEAAIVIELPGPDTETAAGWCGRWLVDVVDGKATLFKAVDDNWTAGHGYIETVYEPGTTVVASDWDPKRRCGGGLHLSPRPFAAARYSSGGRFVAVEVDVDGMVPLDDKVKVPSCRVLWEVDVDGGRVGSGVAS